MNFAGCSSAPDQPPTSEQTLARLDTAIGQLTQASHSSVSLVAEPWLGLEPLPEFRVDPLPDDLLSTDGVTLAVEVALAPAEWAARLSAILEMPVQLTGELPAELKTRPATRAPWRPSSAPAEGAPAIWTGPLDAFLDAWTAAYGFEWIYDDSDGVVRVVRSKAALLQIDALAGERSVAMSMSSASVAARGSGSSAGGASSQRFELSYDEDLWEQVLAQIQALATRGTSITLSEATGTVAIHGLPADIARVRAFLDDQNNSVLRPVSVTLEVLGLRNLSAGLVMQSSELMNSIPQYRVCSRLPTVRIWCRGRTPCSREKPMLPATVRIPEKA